MKEDTPTSLGVGCAEALARAGFRPATCARWFGVPLVTDVGGATRDDFRGAAASPRVGVGAWIALLVAGERVAAETLRRVAGLAPVYDALVALGVVEESEGTARAAWALVPLGDVVVVCDRLDARDDDRVGFPDISALNTWGCLPAQLGGKRVADAGTGGGLLALAAARRGAEVWGGEVHARSLVAAELGRRLNLDVAAQEDCRFELAPLLDGAGEGLDVAVWNAPLLRAGVAGTEVGAASYMSAPGAEAAVLRFVDEAERRLTPGGELLLHAQLTPALEARLTASDGCATSLVFAWAPDGTAHALTRVRRGAQRPAGRRRARVVPLGAACPFLRRAILDAIDADDGAPLRADDTVVAAAWLELRHSHQLDERGAHLLERRFGAMGIDEDDEKLLRGLDGRTLSQLGVDGTRRERLERLRTLGLALRR